MARFDPLHRMKQRSLRLKSKRREGGTSFCSSEGGRAIRRVMLNAGSRLATFFCLFRRLPIHQMLNAKIKINRKGYSFYGSSILTLSSTCLGIFIIFKIFNLSIKIFFKLLINALIESALLFCLTYLGLLNLSFFYINITWLTALITGIFKIPALLFCSSSDCCDASL